MIEFVAIRHAAAPTASSSIAGAIRLPRSHLGRGTAAHKGPVTRRAPNNINANAVREEALLASCKLGMQ